MQLIIKLMLLINRVVTIFCLAGQKSKLERINRSLIREPSYLCISASMSPSWLLGSDSVDGVGWSGAEAFTESSCSFGNAVETELEYEPGLIESLEISCKKQLWV